MQLQMNESPAGSRVINDDLAQENMKRWFGMSQAVDAEGAPQVFYHSTFDKFSVFKEETDYHLGFHVGSLASAQARIDVKRLEMERDGRAPESDPIVLDLFVKAENPLRLNECRTGHWGASTILQMVIDKAEQAGVDGITLDDIDDFYEDQIKVDGQSWGDPGRELSDNDFVRKWLVSKNIDSIIYRNEFEGGGDCYILLHPTQMKSAAQNAGLFDENNPSIYDDAQPALKARRKGI